MKRINLVCLGVEDLKAALIFYNGSGFETYEKADSSVIKGRGFNGITLACNVKSEDEKVDDKTLVIYQ